MCRGGSFEKPPVFQWEAPDGSRVLVNYETSWYLNRIGPHLAKNVLEFSKKTGLKDWMNVFGVGDHGGGPTRKDIVYAHEMNTWPIFPRWVFTTAKRYYQILEAQKDTLPVVKKELNFEFTGCYTTQIADQAVQPARREPGPGRRGRGRTRLARSSAGPTRPSRSATRGSTCCSASSTTSCRARACAPRVNTSPACSSSRPPRSAWSRPRRCAPSPRGSTPPSPAPTWPGRAAEDRWDRSMGAGAGRGTETGGLSSASHQRDGPRAMVVFNPTAEARAQMARVTIWDPGNPTNLEEMRRKTYVVHTADGRVLPAEPIETGSYWGDHFYSDLVFPITVGPMGYASFVIEEGAVHRDPPWAGQGQRQARRRTLERAAERRRVDDRERVPPGALRQGDRRRGLAGGQEDRHERRAAGPADGRRRVPGGAAAGHVRVDHGRSQDPPVPGSRSTRSASSWPIPTWRRSSRG